jgi:glycosyltransferase involved in cell wall biosynthesis
MDNVRDPSILYNALNMLHRNVLKKIRIDIYGNTPQRFRCHIPKLVDMGIVKYYTQVPNQKIPALQSEADVLLLFSNSSPYQLQSKVFEYAAAKRPILCIKQKEPDITENFVKEYHLGWVVQNNEGDIAEFIKSIVRKKMYNLPVKSTLDINSISWEARAEQFYSFLKRICRKTLA